MHTNLGVIFNLCEKIAKVFEMMIDNENMIFLLTPDDTLMMAMIDNH